MRRDRPEYSIEVIDEALCSSSDFGRDFACPADDGMHIVVLRVRVTASHAHSDCYAWGIHADTYACWIG